MTAAASRILYDSTDLIALAESNQRFAGLTSDQRFWYRMAMEEQELVDVWCNGCEAFRN